MRKQELWKVLIAGTAAGLAGTVAMTQFQNLWSKASEKLKTNGNQQSSGDSSGKESEDATMKVAGKAAETTGRHLSHEENKEGGLARTLRIRYWHGDAIWHHRGTRST